jgi:capsular polysaccharide biosynthesis protein
MNFVFSPPSLDDLVRLLKAWRFWLLGAILGALIGTAIFYLVPPPYQARATVLVDFNLEEAWPQETDRQQFFYLERETRKLEEIALSDEVMNTLSADLSIPVDELRSEKLRLGQPAEGGWHFYAEDRNAEQAQELAAAWALIFTEKVREAVATSGGLNSFIQVNTTQTENLPVERSIPLSQYLLVGSIALIFLSSFFVLFFPFSSFSGSTAERTSPHSSPTGRGAGVRDE